MWHGHCFYLLTVQSKSQNEFQLLCLNLETLIWTNVMKYNHVTAMHMNTPYYFNLCDDEVCLEFEEHHELGLEGVQINSTCLLAIRYVLSLF